MRSAAAAVALTLLLGACSNAETTPNVTPGSAASTSTSLASGTTTTSTTAPSTSTSTTTTTTTTVSQPASPPGWTAVPAGFDDVTLTDGAARDGRIVVVGCRRDAATSTRSDTPLPVWWSDDLTSWERGDGTGDVRCLTQVAATRFGFFAVGSGQPLWSEDGAAWQALELHEPLGLEFPGQLGVAQAVLVSPAGDRATLLYTAAAENESTIATLVTTTDGAAWELGPPDSAAQFDSSGVSGVVSGGDGLLAVGSSPGGEFVPTAAVFTSPDGLTWRRVTPRTAEFNDAVMTAIAVTEGGYVAVGGDFFVTGLMTAWISPDGLVWTRSPHPNEETDPSVAFMTAEAVTADGAEVWASGIDSDARRGDGPPLPALWTSTDAGATWSRIDIPDVESAIPFVIWEDEATTLATWPPPTSLVADATVLLIRDEP